MSFLEHEIMPCWIHLVILNRSIPRPLTQFGPLWASAITDFCSATLYFPQGSAASKSDFGATGQNVGAAKDPCGGTNKQSSPQTCSPTRAVGYRAQHLSWTCRAQRNLPSLERKPDSNMTRLSFCLYPWILFLLTPPPSFQIPLKNEAFRKQNPDRFVVSFPVYSCLVWCPGLINSSLNRQKEQENRIQEENYSFTFLNVISPQGYHFTFFSLKSFEVHEDSSENPFSLIQIYCFSLKKKKNTTFIPVMIDFTGDAKDGRVHDQKKKKKKRSFSSDFYLSTFHIMEIWLEN